MKNIKNAKWIRHPEVHVDKAVDFCKSFAAKGKIASATLEITALGVFEAKINGKKVGDFVFAPGWTSYNKRLQVETCDVTDLIKANNRIVIGVAPGWRGNYMAAPFHYAGNYIGAKEVAMLCALEIVYENGETEVVYSGKDWKAKESKVRYSNIYNGYIYDCDYVDAKPKSAVEFPHPDNILIDRVGEKIIEVKRVVAKKLIITPKGETVIDFGQNLTGYVEFTIKGNAGEMATIRHAEVLDAEGNFYTENLRGAKAEAVFICNGKKQTYKPPYNFYGFRYICLDGFSDEIKLKNFTAVVVHSEMKRTGYFECSDARINKLFSNIVWGQRGNFLDVPTDCPQRDERLGWTGDAQVFIKTAAYNYDVERFFIKWLGDLRADQTVWGTVPHVIPDVFGVDDECSSAWADAATVCPWQIYLSYANKQILEDSADSMKDYIDYIKTRLVDGLWVQHWHFGDWLNLDASTAEDCSKGTDKLLIATAFFIYSSEIFIKTLKILGKESEEYEALRNESIKAFLNKYMKEGRIATDYATQTACALALHFGITDNAKETAAQLAELVSECGHIKTGFVGTPYILHALSDNGYTKLAYDLVLREEYPSWLFSVKMGATTIWEHWDSVREDGTMWSTTMNSFNHYAYGCVGDWLYGDAAGIKADESNPGYANIIFRPLTDERLDYVKASLETRKGLVKSEWKRENGKVTYTFVVPEESTATAYIGGKKYVLKAGTNEITE
ncbi:MAG: family 78 glycoside hydrolase catalytic domain [Clostridia bacterium]|nr:family 78 glycoside hydrolase catalytic domain [Clostridia bacterium]